PLQPDATFRVQRSPTEGTPGTITALGDPGESDARGPGAAPAARDSPTSTPRVERFRSSRARCGSPSSAFAKRVRSGDRVRSPPGTRSGFGGPVTPAIPLAVMVSERPLAEVLTGTYRYSAAAPAPPAKQCDAEFGSRLTASPTA